LQNDRDVGNVENFGTMFMMATSFNGDLSKWRVNKATTMNQMFYESYFVGNLHKWYEENIDKFFCGGSLLFLTFSPFSKQTCACAYKGTPKV